MISNLKSFIKRSSLEDLICAFGDSNYRIILLRINIPIGNIPTKCSYTIMIPQNKPFLLKKKQLDDRFFCGSNTTFVVSPKRKRTYKKLKVL